MTNHSVRLTEMVLLMYELLNYSFNKFTVDIDNQRNCKINLQLYADSVIIFSQYRGAKLIAENSKAPVYLYKFTYQGRYSFTMWNATTPYGKSTQ